MPDDHLVERLRDVVIGDLDPVRVELADPDPTWPARFEEHAQGIRSALGAAATAVEHIGSTAVPDLAAKPIIDILLVVVDPNEETAYLPQLEDAGYELRVREPDFDGHRMLRMRGASESWLGGSGPRWTTTPKPRARSSSR